MQLPQPQMSFKEIARVLGLHATQVERAYNAGMEKLRAMPLNEAIDLVSELNNRREYAMPSRRRNSERSVLAVN